jgi:hypothetical protein
MTFTLWNLQGVMRFANPGTPNEQTYSEYLQIAIQERWIKPTNKPNTYRRTGHLLRNMNDTSSMHFKTKSTVLFEARTPEVERERKGRISTGNFRGR